MYCAGQSKPAIGRPGVNMGLCGLFEAYNGLTIMVSFRTPAIEEGTPLKADRRSKLFRWIVQN